MDRWRSWVLTDVSKDTWLDAFEATGPQGGTVRKRRLHGGLRDGVDLITVENGALAFDVLPTRGMGLWRGRYNGLTLGWQAPIDGPVHPAFVNLQDRGGLGWLNGFDEWICRCGLHSNGPPGKDGDEALTLHGRIANVPARYVEVRLEQQPPHTLMVVGQVDEATLFFGRLRLTTEISTTPGSNRLTIRDSVQNLGAKPADLELLYHCQFGPPFLGAGSELRLPTAAVAPRDARAAQGIDGYAAFDAEGGPDYTEQAYFFAPLAGKDGNTLALLHNRDQSCGVALRFNKVELPWFTLWKNTAAAADGYVTGLEPALNFPNFKATERARGRVKQLAPGEAFTCSLTVEVHDRHAGVAEVLKEVAAVQGQARPTVHRQPVAEFSG
jgi:galactose mutarotase-like enzyme